MIPNNRLFKTLCTPVIMALDSFGIKSTFRPRNDIEIKGRKISGTGGTESDDAFLFQGTMLTAFDVDTMLRSLRIPVDTLHALRSEVEAMVLSISTPPLDLSDQHLASQD